MKSIQLIAGLLFVVACAKQTTQTAQKPINDAVASAPSLTSEELNRAQDLMKRHCGSCHKQHDPMAFSSEKWSLIVPKMVNKVNGKAGSEVLSKSDKDLIIAFRNAGAGR